MKILYINIGTLGNLTNNINFNFNTSQMGGVRNTGPLQRVNISQSVNETRDVFTRSSSPFSQMQQVQIPNLEDLYSPMQLMKLYANDENINKLIKSNPKVVKMLQEKGYEAKANSENLTKVTQSHLRETTNYALQIADVIGLTPGEKRTLEKACVFHDFGKALIPTEILSKNSELTKQEKEVMDLHTDLGYELLSKTKLNKRVLNLVRDHHKPQSEESDILGQILTVADIYSALREQRSYKQALTKEQAFTILDDKAKRGEVNQEIVDILRFTTEQAA